MNDVTLIEYYRPTGSEVEAAAERVRDRLPAIRGLAGRVEKDHKRVLDQVAGDLKSSMANAPDIAVVTSSNVTQKAEFAAGCLELFSQRIDEHNHLKSDRPRSARVGFWKDFAGKRAALIHDLRREAAELGAWLDRRADDISAMLRRGPNTEDVRKLWRAGALSPYAPLVFPNADLAKVKLPSDARRELLEDLIAHPELLMAMPPALKAVVDGLKEIKDRDGKSFFLLPTNISGDDAKKAVLMTYILNAGTGYQVDASTGNLNLDYAPTPYGSAEVQRIVDRQNANSWSYDSWVANFQDEGGRVVATPNGMMVGAAGSWQQNARSWAMDAADSGGVCVGDVFVPNQAPDDPERWLEA